MKKWFQLCCSLLFKLISIKSEKKFVTNYTKVTRQFGNRFIYALNRESGRGYRSWEPGQHKTIAAYIEYWRALRKKIEIELFDTFKLQPRAFVSTAAVVHARCGDVPFKRNPAYRLPPHSFYKFAAQQILLQGATRILIHRSPERRKRQRQFFACAVLINQTAHCLQNATGLPTQIIQTQEERHALSDFLGARLLIVPIASTFSFAPGLCLGKPKFVTAAFPLRQNYLLDQLAHQVSWTLMHNEIPFDHDDVIDYYQDILNGRFLPPSCPRLNETTSLSTRLCYHPQQMLGFPSCHNYIRMLLEARDLTYLNLPSQNLLLDICATNPVSISDTIHHIELYLAAATCYAIDNASSYALGFELDHSSQRRLRNYLWRQHDTNIGFFSPSDQIFQ